MNPTILTTEIDSQATRQTMPDRQPYRSLSSRSVNCLSKTHGIDGREVEIAALQQQIIPERYVRNSHTLSSVDQIHLLESCVAIVGLGGLGGAVTEILARTGIGRLRLIDGDRFEDSNLNRQILSSQKSLEFSKAETALHRVHDINQSVQVSVFQEFLTDSNGPELLAGANVVVDCLDSLKHRYMLERISKMLGIPLISAALAGMFAQITTIFPEDAGLCLVYGEPENMPEKGAETHLGTLAPTAMLAASLECAEVIKVLLNKKEILRNRLLVVDLFSSQMEVLPLTG
ncbi:MAG: HesA/MoeB/ThiF family protein [Desulfatirhabdiaceae bacterium]